MFPPGKRPVIITPANRKILRVRNMPKRLFLIPPETGKRIIAKGVLADEAVKEALRSHTLVVIAGSTNARIAAELLGEEFPLHAFLRGCLGRRPETGPFPGDVVMRRGEWDRGKEIFDVAGELGAGDALILQFIELQMVGSAIGGFYRKYHHDLREYEAVLKRRAVKEVERTLHRRHQYKLPNGVWVEIVRPMHNSIFCMNDTRIRITHDGKFKPCLFRNDNLVDFLGAMRGGASDEELAERFKLAVRIREPFFKPLSLPSSSDELSASRAS